ncbi:MAG: T9SS type A sorting domain-containing protein [Spirosomataceae bacterium]
MKKLFTLLVAFLMAFSSQAAIYRVNVSVVGGSNNGTSWPNAFSSLSSALAVAVSGDQIWVAKGTYIPGASASDIFLIPSGVSVYGGFAGGETVVTARNFTTNVTTLSGNSVCNHVVGLNDVTAATLLDGFTISGASGGAIGGGIYNYGGSNKVTIQNCIIKNNSAGQGAGMCNDGSTKACNPTISNCTFMNNSSNSQGSGVFNYAPSSTIGGTYTNCIFDANGSGQGSAVFNSVKNGVCTMSFSNCEFKNHANSYHYAVDNYGEGGTNQLSFTSCSFSNNSGGGAIFFNSYNSTNNNTLTLTNCTFSQNGGTNTYYPYGSAVGIYAQRGKCTTSVSGCSFSKNGGYAFHNDGSYSGQANGTFTNCSFTENYGIALYNYGANNGKSNQTVTNCTFSKNGSSNASAALYNNAASNGEAICSLSGCTFSENKAGAVYNYENFKGSARPTFTNCTFSNNSNTQYYGAAVYNNGAGDNCPIFTDCKFLNNTSTGSGAAVYNFFGYNSSLKNNTVFTRCTFTGNTTSDYNGGGAIYNNFIGIVSVKFEDCIVNQNKATASGSSGGGMTNFANNSATGTLTVLNTEFNENEAGNSGGGVYNNGGTINYVYTNCQFNKNKLASAINSSSGGGGGIYNHRNYNGSGSLTFTDCQINENTANLYGGGVVNNGNSSIYNVQYIRCSISNNTTAGESSYINSISYLGVGGGICNFSVKTGLKMTDCTINGNIAKIVVSNVSYFAWGGGFYNNDTNPTLTNCTINGNKGRGGGGIYSISSSNDETKLINCKIQGNEATGIASYSGEVVGNGGGVANHNGKMILTNCLITGNKAQTIGGGVFSGYNNSDKTTLINCTVAGNSAATAGGIYYHNTPLALKNTIVWGNSSGLEGYWPSFTIDNSVIQGLNPSGTGNLDGTLASSNPLFVSLANFSAAPTLTGDYHLTACSPAINAGNNSANTTTTDLDGNNRKISTIDMGAFEYVLPLTFNVAGGGTVCTGAQGVAITLSGSQVGISYQLKRDNVNVGTPKAGTGSTLSFNNQSVGGTYTIVTVGDCGTTMNGSATILSPKQDAAFTTSTGKNYLCPGSALTLIAPSQPDVKYEWLIGNSSFTPAQTGATLTVTQAGPYTLKVTGTGVCKTTESKTVYITASQPVSYSATSTLTANKLTLIANPTGATYSWSGPNSFTSTLRNPVITPPTSVNAGVYQVSMIISSSGCTGTASVSVKISSPTRLASGEEDVELFEVNAYPNPVSNLLVVEVKLKEASALKLNLINSVGQVVQGFDSPEESLIHKKEIDMSSFKEGLYLIEVQSKDGKMTKRVIKAE